MSCGKEKRAEGKSAAYFFALTGAAAAAVCFTMRLTIFCSSMRKARTMLHEKKRRKKGKSVRWVSKGATRGCHDAIQASSRIKSTFKTARLRYASEENSEGHSQHHTIEPIRSKHHFRRTPTPAALSLHPEKLPSTAHSPCVPSLTAGARRRGSAIRRMRERLSSGSCSSP